MKTNKILTEELSRIMEIMGVNSNTSSLITESIFDDIISGGIKLLGDTSDITKFTNKLSGEYGIPVNTPAVKRQIDEFVNINTSPIRKKEIFIDLIDEMDINGIFKISDDLFKTNKIQSIIEDQVDAIKTAIQSGNFTLPSGKLDEISISNYIDEFTNSQIKTTNPSLRRVTDRLKTQIDDKISVEIRGTKVGKIAGNTVNEVLYDIETKINGGRGFTQEQENVIEDFKTKFSEDDILNKRQLLFDRLVELKKLASEGNVDAVKTISKLRKIANEVGGVTKDAVDGIIDSTGKASLIMGKIPAKGWIGISIAAVLVMGTVGVYGFSKEFSSGVYTKGTKLYCWTNNVSTFTELDLNERKFLSDATGITCEDFDGDDLSRIPVLVKKFISKNTQKPYYVVKFKDDTTKKYDENFKISKPKSKEPELQDTGESTTSNKSCPGKDNLKNELITALEGEGLTFDQSLFSFDENKCVGTYEGSDYSWNGNEWI